MESSSQPKSANSVTARKPTARRQTAFISLLLVAYAIWGGLLLIGHIVLFEYEMTAGPFVNLKRIFPTKSSILLTHGRPNIILFLHPCCPCSVASVDEFHQLMREGEKDAIGTVVFYMPHEQEAEWSHQPIVSSVKRIRNTSVLYDTDGSQAELFGAATSGHVFIFDGRGVLQFSGGITGSRGHTGDNHNFEMARATIIDRRPKFATAPVFGCSLRGVQ